MLLLAAAAIQLRKLTGNLHAIVTRESVQPPPHAIFFDFPSRIADVLMLVPVGYAVHKLPYGVELAWSAALLGLFNAYVRSMGNQAPEQKSRLATTNLPMMLLSAACILSLFDSVIYRSGVMLWTALIVLNVAALVKIWQRTLKIVQPEEMN